MPREAAVSDPVGDELHLVSAVLRKDRKATAELVARYTDPVYAYVRRRLAPHADAVDDIVQDVFVAALDGFASFRGAAPLQSWLLGIARHKVETYFRERLRQFESLDADNCAEPVADGLPIDERIGREQLQGRAQKVLGMLPEAYGAALLWRYWENRSVREIALATGKTEKAVERLLARARIRFRELWEA
jgi:RNA polymerase sigma-70 factor, ECF subfamily